MAWSANKVFAYAQLQMASKVVNLSSDSYKVALYASGTPDNTVTTAVLTEYNGAASQWVTANESSGTGYTAGGAALAGQTLTQSSNVVTFSGSNTTWTTVTVTTVGCLVYDTTVSNEGLAYLYFGGSQAIVGANLTIAWNASGIAYWTC